LIYKNGDDKNNILFFRLYGSFYRDMLTSEFSGSGGPTLVNEPSNSASLEAFSFWLIYAELGASMGEPPCVSSARGLDLSGARFLHFYYLF